MSFDSVDAAYRALADKESTLTWLLAKYENSQLILVGTGSGDLSEMKASFDPKSVNFGVYKVVGVDEGTSVTSRRDKLTQISFVPPTASRMQRLNVLNSKQIRTQTFSGTVCEVQTDDEAEINERDIAKQLLASGGAHKPTHYQFGSVAVPLSEL